MSNTEFSITNKGELTDLLAGKILGDPSLTNKVISADIEADKEIKEGDLSLSAKAKSSLSLQFFNQPTDPDADQLLGTGDDALIRFKSETAYVKKTLLAEASGNFNLDKSPIKAGLKASGEVKMANYRPFPPGTPALDATMANDQLLPLRTIIRWADIADMDEEELVYLSKGGSVDMCLSVAAADLFTGNLSTLASLLPGGKAVDISFGASFDVDFKLKITNEFNLAIIRLEEDAYRVALIKEKSSESAGSLAFGVEASFVDPAQAQVLLTEAMEALLGKVEGGLERFMDKVKDKAKDELSKKEWKQMLLIAHLLGYDEAAAAEIQKVKDSYDALKAKVLKAIETMANARVTMGITYEFSRIKTSEEVFRAVFTKEALRTAHKQLVSFDLSAVLLRFRDGQEVPGIQLEKYLNQRTYKRVRSLGFTLGIGKWSMGSQSFDSVQRSISTNISGQQQIATKMLYSYTGKLLGEFFTWSTDFNAAMPGFSRETEPKMDEFDLSLYLELDFSENRLHKRQLPILLDNAQLWGAIDGDSFNATVEEVRTSLKKAEDIRYSFEIKYNPVAFAAAIKRLAQLINEGKGDNVIATGMAAAMSWADGVEFRQQVDTRKAAYTQLWLRYFQLVREKGNARNIDMKNEVYEAIKRIDPSFANMATSENAEGVELFFTTIIDNNRHIVQDWSLFAEGIVALQKAIEEQASWSVLEDAYKKLRHFFNEAIYLRALGYVLNEAVRSATGDHEGIEVALRLDYTNEDDQQQSRVIGR